MKRPEDQTPIVIGMGVSHRDLELACLWLCWVAFLANQPGGLVLGLVKILVVYTKKVGPRGAESLVAAARGTGELYPYLMYQECPDEQEDGYPKSASHLFLRTLEAAEYHCPGCAVLWCEADTVPMKPTWFKELWDEYQTCGRPFLGMKIGSTPHMSGNAIYPHRWRTLAPSIANVVNAPDTRLWGPGKGQPWDIYCRDEIISQMAETALIQTEWKHRDPRATPLRMIRPETCLFHQDKTGALIREMAAARYPEFMATISSPRKFYFMNGHPMRLHAKGVRIRFSYTKWDVGGHRSAVCSDELADEEASALAMLVGQLGVREITEEEFLKLTGRRAHSLPEPKVRVMAAAPAAAAQPYSHPSVFVMLGRYGDICNILPMLKAAADAGPRPTLVVSKDFADILDGVSYVDRIVWDGAYDRLPDALRWLRKEKGISAPVICQYHRHPHDKGRLTDSYQKEVWRLAGRLGEFEKRENLYFDKRDFDREEALLKRVTEHHTKPFILIGLESASSPLSNAKDILNGITATFDRTHEIVNLANVKAERVYDLLTLFDAAELLITADTVFLHLARACKVSMIALLNNGWRGSVAASVPTRAFKSIRYADASPQAVVDAASKVLSEGTGASLTRMPVHYTAFGELRGGTRITPEDLIAMANAEIKSPFIPEKLQPGEEMRVREVSMNQVDITVSPRVMREMFANASVDGEKTERVRPLAPNGPAIYHVVDVFGDTARHHLAQASWPAAYLEGITPVPFRGGPRNAKDEIGDPRPLPYLKDVLWSGIPADSANSGDDIIVWSNGDIGLKPGIAAVLRAHISKHGAASMRRTESNGKGHPGRDLFAFTVDWLHEHWDEIPDYILGAPAFDLGLVAMIRKFHGLPALTMKNLAVDMPPAEMPSGYALHQSHKPDWEVANMDSVPSVRHNKKLFLEWAKKYAPEIVFTKGGSLK